MSEINNLIPGLRETDQIRLAGFSALIEQHDIAAVSVQATLDEAHINPINTSIGLRPNRNFDHYLETTKERPHGVLFDDDGNLIPFEQRILTKLGRPELQLLGAAQSIAASRLALRLTANPRLADTAAVPSPELMSTLRKDHTFTDRLSRSNRDPHNRFHFLRTQTRLIAGVALHAVGRTF